jgi:tRNA nucleotidyltransferase (CCA-adding enzyme)
MPDDASARTDAAVTQERRLRPPGPVYRIAKRLEQAGFETWCVGGAVRDALLGIENLDWDLATAAPPTVVRRLFKRTVPVGIEFGTVGVLDEHGRMHEVTTFRRDIRTDGRHAEVEFGVSLDDDLARRDFTINAIAYSPSRGVIHDPFGGQRDLEAGILRAVGDPSRRMVEDRLRALRALRFAARFGFEIDPATWQAILDSSPHLGRLSPERVKQELEKTMEQVRCPSVALAWWRDSGAFATLVPQLAGVPDDILRAVDVHALPRGHRTGDRRMLRLATLFSALVPDEARRVLKSLRFSNADIRWIGKLVELWHELGGEIAAALTSGPMSPTDAEVRRWVARAGRLHIGPFLRVAAARWSVGREGLVSNRVSSGAREDSPPGPVASERSSGSQRPGVPAFPSVARLYRRARETALSDPVELADLAVGGDDLRRAGVQPGPSMARLLDRLLDEVLEDPSRNDVGYLMERVRTLREETC